MTRPSPRHLALASLLLASGAAWAQDNPLARNPPLTLQAIGGQWNGVNLERRTNCSNANNVGDRGTYAQFNVGIDNAGNLTIDEQAVTGLTCRWTAHWTNGDAGFAIQGSYQCSDGKQANFSTRKVDIHGNTFIAQFSAQLTGTETCSIDGMLSLARFYP